MMMSRSLKGLRFYSTCKRTCCLSASFSHTDRGHETPGPEEKKKLLLTEITNFPDYQWALRKGPSGCQNVNWLTSQEKTSKARKPDLPIMGRVCLLHLGGGYYLYFTGTWHPQYLYLLRLFAIKHLWKDVWKGHMTPLLLRCAEIQEIHRECPSPYRKIQLKADFYVLLSIWGLLSVIGVEVGSLRWKEILFT